MEFVVAGNDCGDQNGGPVMGTRGAPFHGSPKVPILATLAPAGLYEADCLESSG